MNGLTTAAKVQLKPRASLPRFDAWSISQQAADHLLAMIKVIRPKHIVECGSGLSTILFGYAAEQYGGKVVALEHDKEHYNNTRRELALHSLEETCSVIHAPIRQCIPVDGTNYYWYDIEKWDDRIEEIDLLFVDGPPGNSRTLARWPALIALWTRLNGDAAIVVDDAMRHDEGVMLQDWVDRYPVSQQMLPCERGLAVLRMAHGEDT